LVFYYTNTASSIATYLQATVPPFSPKTTLTFAGLAIGTDVVKNWATNATVPGLTSLPAGAYTQHIHALKSAGGNVSLHTQFWEVSATGVDIAMIGQTEESARLTGSEAEYTLEFVDGNVYMLASVNSRIVGRVFATVTGSPVTVQIFVGGTADSFMGVPGTNGGGAVNSPVVATFDTAAATCTSNTGSCVATTGTCTSTPGVGTCTLAVTHNLNNSRPGVWVYDASGLVGSAIVSAVPTSANVYTFTFNQTEAGTATITTGGIGPPGGTGPAGPAGNPIRTCVIITGDPGAASPVLADDNDSPVACGNTWGSDWTIQSVTCWANAGSPTVTPILTGGSATSILTGALTCGTAAWNAGTVQALAPVVHSFSGTGATCSSTPCTIDANITTAGGTAKYIVVRIVGTL
jgi:hypothetical protein